MENITDVDYTHAKIACKEVKQLGGCNDSYVQSNTLLLVDVFKNFQNRCLEIYELEPVCFLNAPGLPWEAGLKRTKVKLNLLTDIDILLIVEKEIRGGIYHAIHQYVNANNRYIKDCDKNKES